MGNPFFVVDTNCFISANLIEDSTSALCFDKILREGTIAMSDSIFAEYTEVLYRKKLDKYLTNQKRKASLSFLKKNAVSFNIIERITVCEDPKDNMFLELAVACNASYIITGDVHLLVLNPFREIKILNAITFLNIS
jgi:putative PIN family toxin of toxin-antitoxin system